VSASHVQSLQRAVACAGLLLAGLSGAARADNCRLSIEADDMVQFNARVLQVDAACQVVELTLRHVGEMEAHVLGHDWVLARSSDVSALANAGLAAGFEKGYLPPDDPRVIAATRIVGGGESATITFGTERLQPGVDYAFFCSYPGHVSMMRGRLLLVGRPRLATNRSEATAATP
jgi:azurin